MKKALNLLLGLSLMASAYAKSPAIETALASIASSAVNVSTPIPPIASIALLGLWPTTEILPIDKKLNRSQANLMDEYEYVFAYDSVSGTGYHNSTGDYIVTITVYFVQYDLTTYTYVETDAPTEFSVTSSELGTLTWPTGQTSFTFPAEFPGAYPPGLPVTVSPSSYNGIPVANVALTFASLDEFPN